MTKRRARFDLTTKVIDHFFSIYDQVAEVKGLFAQAEVVVTSDAINKIRKLGDWYNLVATYCRTNSVNPKLLAKAVVLSEMKIFKESVNGVKARITSIGDAWKWWPELDKIEFSRYQ
jgi:hypothetical protein